LLPAFKHLCTTTLGLLATFELLRAAAFCLLATLRHHVAAFRDLLLTFLPRLGTLERRTFHALDLTVHTLGLAFGALRLTLHTLRRLPFGPLRGLPFGTLLLGRAFGPLGLALLFRRAFLVAPALSGGGRGNSQRRDARDQ
jgi:hypothetical protein